MRVAALITAAGMPSRQEEFAPMMNMGSISVAQRVVATFQQAGVDRIVMITGFHATTLERHLSGNGIIFLRNENYATTRMFESVKIGLSYLKDKCDAVLLTPVDIPLFTAQTVRDLMDSGAKLACPVCNGHIGHPNLIHVSLIDGILQDCGEQGLKGALIRSGVKMVPVVVSDPGTLHDTQTPEDCSALLRYHNSQLVRPEVHVVLSKEKPFFDSRVAMLLMLVEETSSVRAAGKRMQLSYSSCWNMIRTLESQMNCTLVERSQGGPTGSNSVLTRQGKLLLRCFNRYEQQLRDEAERLFDDCFAEIFNTQEENHHA